MEVLSKHRGGLNAIARALLDNEIIDGAEVARLVDEAHGSPVHGEGAKSVPHFSGAAITVVNGNGRGADAPKAAEAPNGAVASTAPASATPASAAAPSSGGGASGDVPVSRVVASSPWPPVAGPATQGPEGAASPDRLSFRRWAVPGRSPAWSRRRHHQRGRRPR